MTFILAFIPVTPEARSGSALPDGYASTEHKHRLEPREREHDTVTMPGCSTFDSHLIQPIASPAPFRH